MKFIKAVICAMALTVLCVPVSFAVDFDLDAPAGMFGQQPFDVKNYTAIKAEIECVEEKKDEKWKPTFGIQFEGQGQVVFVRFFKDKSSPGVFNASLEIWQNKEKIKEGSLGRSVSLNEVFAILCDWSDNKLKVYLNNELLMEPVDMDVDKIIFSSSTAKLVIKDLQFRS